MNSGHNIKKPYNVLLNEIKGGSSALVTSDRILCCFVWWLHRTRGWAFMNYRALLIIIFLCTSEFQWKFRG
jgi:hypothetical protein